MSKGAVPSKQKVFSWDMCKERAEKNIERQDKIMANSNKSFILRMGKKE